MPPRERGLERPRLPARARHRGPQVDGVVPRPACLEAHRHEACDEGDNEEEGEDEGASHPYKMTPGGGLFERAFSRRRI